jgi:hypothetical protein
MLSFLESSIAIDATGLSFGGAATATTYLTLDQRSSAGIVSFTVTVPPNGDSSVPYTATLTFVDTQKCLLTITFGQPMANVHFNEIRTLTITANNSDTYNLDLQINYTDAFILANWQNSADIAAISDLATSSPLTTPLVNNRFLALLRFAITGLNKAKELISRYAIKKSLPDIIDFAIMSGTSPIPATATLTTDSNCNILTLTTVYSDAVRGVSQKILVTYTYSTYTIKRVIKRNNNFLEVTNENISLLSSLTIDALDNSNNIIYHLGTVTINRTETIIAVPGIPDYNDTLPPETINTDPNNIVSDYKYYKTFVITGWTVVA